MKKQINCIGIVMDGNRRWAKGKGLPQYEGHSKGYDKLKAVLRWSKEFGIENVMVYAFSTENWGRKETEIKYLFKLFRRVINEGIEELHKEGARVKFVGQIERFPKDIQEGIKEAEAKTKNNKELGLYIALSYGGRAEILNATNKLLELKKQKVTEKEFEKYLWTAGMPDPEIIIRTGGDTRLSNFLPWQGVYSELYFIKTLWPAFSKNDFKKVLDDFYGVERRLGK